MKANRDSSKKDEDAVSPVIAVILMVAITVVLAATVYIWVTSFSQTDQRSVQASVQLTALDGDADARNDQVRLLLSNALDAPFAADQVYVTSNGNASGICVQQMSAPPICADAFGGADTWRNGGSLYMDCAFGSNEVVVTIRQSVVLSQVVRCDE